MMHHIDAGTPLCYKLCSEHIYSEYKAIWDLAYMFGKGLHLNKKDKLKMKGHYMDSTLPKK